MTSQSFQSWLAVLDRLSTAQWSQLQQAVQERSEGAAAVAAIELQIDTEWRCPHCQAGGATVGQVLASVSQASLQAALVPVLASDAVLVSDGGRGYPGCARRWGRSTRRCMCRRAGVCARAITSKA